MFGPRRMRSSSNPSFILCDRAFRPLRISPMAFELGFQDAFLDAKCCEMTITNRNQPVPKRLSPLKSWPFPLVRASRGTTSHGRGPGFESPHLHPRRVPLGGTLLPDLVGGLRWMTGRLERRPHRRCGPRLRPARSYIRTRLCYNHRTPGTGVAPNIAHDLRAIGFDPKPN